MLTDAKLLLYVLCPKVGWLTERLSQEGISYRVLDAGFQWHQYFPSVFRLFRLLWSFPDDEVVILHLHGRFPLLVSLLPVMFTCNHRFVATVHQFAVVGSPGIIGWKARLETILLRRMSRVWCVSQALKDEVVTRIGSHRESLVEAIPNWIENSSCRMNHDCIALESKDQAVRLCAVGRLSYEKGFDILVEALGSMVAAGWNIVCDIYGTGVEERNLEALIHRRGLEGRVFFRGISYPIRKILGNYQAVVIPSRSESFGIVALEAFDAGIPVVASRLPGLSEIVIHEETGLMFEAENFHALQEALERLLGSKELTERLVFNAADSLKSYSRTMELELIVRRFYELAIR